MKFQLRKPYRFFAYFLTAIIVVLIIGLIIYFLVRNNDDSTKTATGAVVTNGHTCAKIGATILNKGGNAVDAAIAALFCEGVAMPQSMGLGGGFLMTIYLKKEGVAKTLNAREMAPKNASEEMFNGNLDLATKGGLAVAVPGELKGYWEAYQKFGGKIAWRELVQPTIDLCRNGILVTDYLGRLFENESENIKKDKFLKEVFIDQKTDKAYIKGQYIYRPRLAQTLEIIAKEGAETLYNGALTKNFVKDIQDNGGIITEEDMKNYKVEWQDPIQINVNSDEMLYTSPLPGSGAILSFILNLLNDFLDETQPSSLTNWQRIVESFKFGYGKRTELGDSNFVDTTELIANLTSPEYANEIRKKILDDKTFNDPEYYGAKTVQPEDHGTAHISVLAPNGDAVSVTSTINLYFGAGFMSESTGIILNDQMDDFSSPNLNNSFGLPPSVANFIKPGKRPLSSMCPSIIVDKKGDVLLVVGAAGGSKITTSVAQITVKNLWFNTTIQEAVSDPRLHHQLVPMRIDFEYPFGNDMDFVNNLHQLGHDFLINDLGTGFSAVTAISAKGGEIKPATDSRRTGEYALVFK